MSWEDSYDDYPGGVLEKYIINPLVDYILCPVVLGIIKIKKSLDKIVSQE